VPVLGTAELALRLAYEAHRLHVRRRLPCAGRAGSRPGAIGLHDVRLSTRLLVQASRSERVQMGVPVRAQRRLIRRRPCNPTTAGAAQAPPESSAAALRAAKDPGGNVIDLLVQRRRVAVLRRELVRGTRRDGGRDRRRRWSLLSVVPTTVERVIAIEPQPVLSPAGRASSLQRAGINRGDRGKPRGSCRQQRRCRSQLGAVLRRCPATGAGRDRPRLLAGGGERRTGDGSRSPVTLRWGCSELLS
jgi:hypothetical protein